MSMRTRVLGMVDVIMRVPPLFIIDEILKISMGMPGLTGSGGGGSSGNVSGGLDGGNVSGGQPKLGVPLDFEDSLLDSWSLLNRSGAAAGAGVAGGLAGTAAAAMSGDSGEYLQVWSLSMLKFFVCLLGWLAAACVFMLWTRHLVIVYMYITSIGLIFLSYWSNNAATVLMAAAPGSILEDVLSLNTGRLLDPNGVAVAMFPHLLAQWMIGLSFSYIHLGPRYPIVQRALPLNFMAPLLLAMLPLPPSLVRHSPAFAAVMPLILCKVVMWSSAFDVMRTIYAGYVHTRTFATNFGLSALVESEWQRLNVPSVLRAFWIIRIVEQLGTSVAFAEDSIPMLATIQNLLVGGCETLTAILGMASIVSVICHYIGKMFEWFLLSEDYDEDKSIGTVSAILFYLLALQTGLTQLSPDKRFVRLCRNFCLLVSALLHFLHNIVAPILMSLSAARNPSMKRHARALIVCVFLLVAPLALLAVLWSRHAPSTWLLAVTAFSLEVIIKVLVSLATYTLFLLDAHRQTFWEKLDDYVYYIRAFGNAVEFCFGIFLFFNGAWILVFESGGAIRAVMMGVHAYFNIWCEARAGWAEFMKRRTAVQKICALPEASEEQLLEFDDVCSICYQSMTTAKITRCGHYFHGVCLRKWLYVQDRCPLCHEIIMHQEPADKAGQPPAAAAHVAAAEAAAERLADVERELAATQYALAHAAEMQAEATATGQEVPNVERMLIRGRRSVQQMRSAELAADNAPSPADDDGARRNSNVSNGSEQLLDRVD